jgi:hypothetical protein
MAQTQATKEDMSEQTNGNDSNGGGTGRTAVRAAAIAAVSGATALAAKKAFVDRGGSGEDKPERSQQKKKGGGNEVFGSMVSSAWDSARDSLVPMLEDAASSAGEYLAQNGPEIVRETIVPRFIDGFERGRGSDSDSDD